MDPALGREGRSGWAVAMLVVLAVATVLMTVLAVTGIQLSGSYRPTAAQSWPALVDLHTGGDGHVGESTARSVHRLAAGLLPATALIGLVVAGGWSVTRRRWTWIGGLGLLVLVVVGGVTGFMLPFDQVALWAVTVGTDFSGVWEVAFGDSVRFIILDGHEISQGQYRAALVAHLVIGVVAAVVVGLLVRTAWRDGRGVAPPIEAE